MWIEELKNGKFKYVERYTDPYTDKLKKISVTYNNKTRKTQKDAEVYLNNKIDEIINKTNTVNKDLTFSDVLTEWLSRYKYQVKSSTYYATEQSIIALRSIIPSKEKLYRIDHIYLNKMFDRLLYERNLSNAYVKIIKSRLSQMFKYAVKNGYIEESPIKKVEISFKRDEHESVESFFLEDDEYQELIMITEQRNLRYTLLFKFLYLNGMRAGEALALTNKDINVDDKNASVNGTLEYHGKKIHEQKKSDSTKTPAGMRDVDLSSKSIDIIDKMNELNEDIDNEFIFCTKNGTPIQVSAINTFLRDYVRPKMTVNKKMSSHIFRHTHVSKLAELGIPLYAIQDRVGHDSSDITEKIYLHVTKDVREKIKVEIEKL